MRFFDICGSWMDGLKYQFDQRCSGEYLYTLNVICILKPPIPSSRVDLGISKIDQWTP